MNPKPWTPEYYQMLARNERWAAKERRQTVESTRVHLANADQYDRLADAGLEAQRDEGNVYTRRQVDDRA